MAQFGRLGRVFGQPKGDATNNRVLEALHRLNAIGKVSMVGDQDGSAMKERLLKAYFVENRNIGDTEVLTAIAAEAGLDADAARAFITSPEERAAVSESDAQARQLGVSGVPFFIFNRQLAVSGAQDPATLLAAMQQAVAGTPEDAGTD